MRLHGYHLLSLRLGHGYCFAKFPISFAVELVGTNEDSTAALSGVQQKQIRRHPFVVRDFDDVSDLETRGSHLRVSAITSQLPKLA